MLLNHKQIDLDKIGLEESWIKTLRLFFSGKFSGSCKIAEKQENHNI